MQDTNHQELLDRFDGKAFRKKMSHQALIQAIVNYHLVKHPDSSISVENFENFYPESGKIGVYAREIENTLYRVDYSLEKENFEFYLNDELYAERYALLLDIPKVPNESDKFQMQAQDFNLLSSLLLHQQHLDLFKNKYLGREDVYKDNQYSNLYRDIFVSVYSLEYSERDDDLDGIKNRFDDKPYLNNHQMER